MHALALASRSLARRPAFAITAVLTLALGVGATTTMFSVVDAVLLKPLPFPRADRLVTVMEANPATTQKLSLIAPGRLEDWNRASRAFDVLSGSYSENVTDTSGADPQRLGGRRVAPRFFGVFRMPALVGRTFTEEEEHFGGPTAAVNWLRITPLHRFAEQGDVEKAAIFIDHGHGRVPPATRRQAEHRRRSTPGPRRWRGRLGEGMTTSCGR